MLLAAAIVIGTLRGLFSQKSNKKIKISAAFGKGSLNVDGLTLLLAVLVLLFARNSQYAEDGGLYEVTLRLLPTDPFIVVITDVDAVVRY